MLNSHTHRLREAQLWHEREAARAQQAMERTVDSASMKVRHGFISSSPSDEWSSRYHARTRDMHQLAADALRQCVEGRVASPQSRFVEVSFELLEALHGIDGIDRPVFVRVAQEHPDGLMLLVFSEAPQASAPDTEAAS